MLADKGYDADAVREELLLHGTRPVIPPRSTRKHPPSCDYIAYKDRNRIERMFNKLKQFRRIATRYDKTKASFAGFLALASVKIWLPSCARGPFRALLLRSPEGEPSLRRFLDNSNLHVSPKFTAKTRGVAGSPYANEAFP